MAKVVRVVPRGERDGNIPDLLGHAGKSECLLIIRRIEVIYTQPERVLTSYAGANNKK